MNIVPLMESIQKQLHKLDMLGASEPSSKDLSSSPTDLSVSPPKMKCLCPAKDSKDIVQNEKDCEKITQNEKDITQTPMFTEEDVSYHCDMSSCWIIIDGKVYDVTEFLNEHPGGIDIMLEYGGLDATAPFSDVGHSKDAKSILQKYYIGDIIE